MGTRSGPRSADANVLRAADQAFARGRLVQARAGYGRAFEDAVRSGDAVVMARAALGLGGLWVNERRGPDEYARYREQLQHSLRALGDKEPLLGARLAARLAAEECYAGGAPLSEAREAAERVRGFGDASATSAALSLLHHLLLAPHDRVEREQVAYELELVAARDDSPFSALMGLVWTTIDAFLAGDAEAPRSLARLRLRAEQLDHAAISFLARMIDLMLRLRAGRIAEVEAALDDVHALGVEAGEVDATPWMAGQLLAVRWLQGRQHEVLDAARALADSPDLTRFNRVYPAVWAAFAASAGEHDEGRVALARVDPFGSPPFGLAPSSMWLITMFAVVEAIRHLGDDESAARAYDMLAPFAELPLIGSLGIVCFGSTHRSLAWCALTYGDRDRGIGHFRRAIDHDIGIGNLPMLAMTRAELAHTIALEDARSAGTLYQQAIDSGSRFDMVRWIEIWQDEQRSLLERRARPLPARCCRQGNVWHLEVGSAHVLVPHCIGMTMICDLVASPYADIPVAGLTGAPHTATRQKVLDARARDELRRRVNELQRRIDLADDHGDTALSQQLCEELDRIKVELSRNLGLGGGSREFATPTERARTSVQKAIRRALDSIAEQAPELASELRRSIHTGTYCRFQPVEGLPSNWVTSR